MSVEVKKHQIIQKITEINDESLLNKLESMLDEYLHGESLLFGLIKPMREKLDIEALKNEQEYQGFDENEVNLLIKEIDFKEPLEELLETI